MSSAPLVGGRYEVHAEIGVGGMATVHLGWRVGGPGAPCAVAIKRLHPHLAKDPEIATMFLDEARLASRIDHPNVVSIVDVVEVGSDVSLVMAYVPGFSLDRVLARAKRSAPAPVALRVAHDALSGLRAAHDAVDERGAPLRLVHRDVSPHNLLVGADGVTRVLDFGVAKADGRLQQRTRTNETKGKVAYMSPEQVLCEPVDARTDLYAVGVCLWEMLAGWRAHEGPEPAIMRAILERTLSPLATAENACATIDALIARATTKDKTARFASADDMLASIEAVGVDMASHAVVAAWVREHLAQGLDERAALVAGMEARAAPDALRSAETPQQALDASPVLPSRATNSSRATWSAIPFIVGGSVAALVVAAWFLGPWRSTASTNEASAQELYADAANPTVHATPTAAARSTMPEVVGSLQARSTSASAPAPRPSSPSATQSNSSSPPTRPHATAQPAASSKRRETLF